MDKIPRIDDLVEFRENATSFMSALEMFEYMKNGTWSLTAYPYEKMFVYVNIRTDEKIYINYWRYKDTEFDTRVSFGSGRYRHGPPESFPI